MVTAPPLTIRMTMASVTTAVTMVMVILTLYAPIVISAKVLLVISTLSPSEKS